MGILEGFPIEIDCPVCKSKNLIGFIDILKHSITCKNCGNAITKEKIRELLIQKEINPDSVKAEKPINSKINIEDTNGFQIIRLPNNSCGCSSAFILMFIAIWTVGIFIPVISSLMTIASDKTSLISLAYMLPFIIVYSVVIYFTIIAFNTKASIYTENRELVIRRDIFNKPKFKRTRFDDILDIKTSYYTTKNGSRSYFIRFTIKKRDKNNNLTGKEKKFNFNNTFLSNLTCDECNYLVYEIKEMISKNNETAVNEFNEIQQADTINTQDAIYDSKDNLNLNSENNLQFNDNGIPLYHNQDIVLDHKILRFGWIIISLFIALPIYFAVNFFIYPIFAAIIIFFFIGFTIARFSPGKTFFEPPIASVLTGFLSLAASLYTISSTESGAVFRLIMRAVQVWHNLFPVSELEIFNLKQTVIDIHIAIIIAGGLVSLIGAVVGEICQQRRIDKIG